MDESPAYRSAVEYANKRFAKQAAKGQLTSAEKMDVVTIPIVFHVIHYGEPVGQESNISEAQIQSAVDGMNIQYRNLNPDGSKFDPDGTDLKFEFCLAKRDPNGNTTNGIVRVDGTSVPGYAQDGIVSGSNEVQVKDLSRWPNDEYYNVWVVAKIDGQNPKGGGTKGYAYFPGANSTVDGTVVLYNSCGYDPDGSKGFDLFGSGDNGTMVHEIGHAFSLYHTFQGADSNGANCPPSESNCVSQGDRICDTDIHKSNLGTCKQVGDPNSCTGGTYDVNIARNYMNYTNCSPLIFTPDQRDRVRNALENDRSYFNNPGTPDVCVPVFEYDAAITNLIAPAGFYCNQDVSPVIAIKNNGQNTLTSFDIEYGVDGNVMNTHTWTGSLTQLASTTITLPGINVSIGTHNFFVRVVRTSINGSNTDEYMPNDEQTGSFEIINGHVLSLSVSNAAENDEVIIIDESTGAPVYSTNFKDVADPYIENVCLPDGCFYVIFKDQTFIHPFFGGTPPSYTLKNDVGYEMASGISNPNYSNAAYSDTSGSFCLPFDPGFIQADFTANKTIVELGDAVQFTDKSKNNANESPDEWAWKFGDGNTSNQQHPNYTYGNAGVYSVELIVDNEVNFPDTMLKKNYIRVVPPITGCDEFNNMLPGESNTFYQQVDGQPGYFPGPNSLGIRKYAERFFASSASSIDYVTFDVKYNAINSSLANAIITVYSETNGRPATALYTQKVPLANLVPGNNQVDFDSPVSVNNAFYVGIHTESAFDTLVIGAAPYRGDNDFSNTAYGFVGNRWNTIENLIPEATATSLDITIKLSFIPKADLFTGVTQTCEGISINFDASASLNAGSYKWTFEDGTPATGFSESMDVSFTGSGSKEVMLVVSGGCNKTDTARINVDINSTPTVTIETLDDVCGSGNGEATANITGGSGDFSYHWSSAPSQTGKTARNLTPGTYTLTWNDLQCNIFNQQTAFSIGNLTQLPSFDVVVTPTTCGGNNGKANAFPVGGTGNYSYEWTSSTYPSFARSGSGVTGLAAGAYSVKVSDGNCQPRTESFNIADSDSLEASVSDPVRICEGEPVTLNAVSTADSIRWEDTGGNVYSGTTLNLQPNISRFFEVYFLDDRGCELMLTTRVEVVQTPSLFAGVSSEEGFNYRDTAYLDLSANQTLAFFSSAGSFAQKFLWDFDDGSTTTEKNPSHHFTTAGTYVVTLTGNTSSCESADTTWVIADGTVSVSEIDGLVMRVYPNPTTGQIYISTSENLRIEQIRLVNIAGQEVQRWAGNRDNLDMGELPRGIYLLQVSTDSGQMYHRIQKK